MLFHEDAEFREWLMQHADKPIGTQVEKPVPQEPRQSRRTYMSVYKNIVDVMKVNPVHLCPYKEL